MKFLASESWLRLKPNVDVQNEKEEFALYYERCQRWFKHIPKDVLEQWIHPFHDDLNTLNSYAWIEYWEDNVTFDLVQLPKYEFKKVYPIKNYSDYFQSRSTFKSWDDIILGEDDLEYWLDQGTWSLPPIIMDTETFKLCAEHIMYEGKFQLIEGHTRIGILNTLMRLGESSKTQIKELHWVYKMSCKSNK
jgi:hypothetical protein